MSRTSFTQRIVQGAVAVAAACSAMVSAATPASAGPQILGAGSTWSANAVKQWVADVHRFGVDVTFSDIGATAGRQYFINEQTDFAVSPLGFQPDETPILAQRKQGYAYVPAVAGGTAFMYNLRGVTDLKLSQRTAVKIFTGAIKRWNDPAIVADTGHGMPDQPIIPIVRADSSGTSAVLSQFFIAREPALWAAFTRAMNYPNTFAQIWPQFPGSLAANLSEGVADLTNRTEGAITYVETSYAIQRSKPVAFVQNQANRFVLPTAANVAIALRLATLNPDGTQNLRNVYTNPDPASYAISSYDFFIVRTDAAHLSAAKGKELSKFIYYAVCAGQQKTVGSSGYSPLPKNLVQVSFDKVRLMPGADPTPDINTCKNPNITGAFKAGTGDPGTGGGTSGGNSGGGGSTGGNAGGGTTGSGGNSASGGSSGTGTGTGTGNGTGTGTGSGTAVGTGTGTGTGTGNGTVGGSDSGTSTAGLASPTTVTLQGSGDTSWWLAAAVVVLLGMVFVPPVVIALTTPGPARTNFERRRGALRRERNSENNAIRAAFHEDDLA